MMVAHLLRPAAAEALYPLADEYYGLLNNLMQWVEKKTNGYPSDAYEGRDSIRPRVQRVLVKAKMEEDHQYPTGHRKVQKMQHARDLTNHSLAVELKRMTNSSYREAFCDEVHEGFLREGSPVPSPPIKPMGNLLPFGVFPSVPASPRRHPREYAEMAAETRKDGMLNKAVFEGPTCL
jgi:hypothetical protein